MDIMSKNINTIEYSDYLSELERRIKPKFDYVLSCDYSSLTLNEEEKYNLKQILKFLLSKEENDAFVKRLDINRTRKYLLSNDLKQRQKGQLILSVLKNLGQFELSAEIVNGMKMSIGAKEIVLNAPSIELQEEYQVVLNDILATLDDSIDNLLNVRKVIEKYNNTIADIKISMSGDAKDSIFRLSNNIIDSHTKMSLKTNSWPFTIFIYPEDLENKLKNSTRPTWRKLVGKKTNQDIICFYIPSQSNKRTILSQESSGFVCKTLKEVLKKVQKLRKKQYK